MLGCRLWYQILPLRFVTHKAAILEGVLHYACYNASTACAWHGITLKERCSQLQPGVKAEALRQKSIFSGSSENKLAEIAACPVRAHPIVPSDAP